MIQKGEFVEWAEVHGNLYGTSRRRLEKIINDGFDVILDIDTPGRSRSGRPMLTVFSFLFFRLP